MPSSTSSHSVFSRDPTSASQRDMTLSATRMAVAMRRALYNADINFLVSKPVMMSSRGKAYRVGIVSGN